MKERAMKPKFKINNFVAKNAQTAGAGAHKDRKRAAKMGYQKHKKMVDNRVCW
jgi:hypothetical protein